MASAAELSIVIKAKDEASRALDGVAKSAKGFSNAFKISGVAAVAGLGAAAVAAKSFVGAASNLGESMSKVNVVFGESAGDIQDWSKKSAKAFGQSRQAALEAAGTYGNLFQAFGVGREKATDMSKTLVELAADLASFNNTSVEEAIIALRSGLSGETEPLKRYGVAINDARLKTEALAQGLISSTKDALDPAAKAQAAYALIMKDTTLAQGDFERTSDGLANQQRILAAEFENIKAIIGTALLPMFTKATEALADFLTGHEADIEQFVTLFSEKVAGAIEAVSPAVETLSKDFKSFGDWIINNHAAIAGAIAVIGVAFLWANPAGVVAAGIGAILIGLGLMRTETASLTEPAIRVKMFYQDMFNAILTGVIDTLEVIETVSTLGLTKLGLEGPVSVPLKELKKAHEDLQTEMDDSTARLLLFEMGLADVASSAPDAVKAIAFLKAIAEREAEATNLATRAHEANTQAIQDMKDAALHADLDPIWKAMEKIQTHATLAAEDVQTLNDMVLGLMDSGDLLTAQQFIFKLSTFAPGTLQGGGPNVNASTPGRIDPTFPHRVDDGGAGGAGGVGVTVNVYADMTDETIKKVATAVESSQNTGLRRTSLQGTWQGGGLFA